MADSFEPPRGTIVTLGGGGFSMSPDGKSLSLIDEHLLQMTGKSRPRVCFLGTASGDSMDYRNRFTHAFKDRAETMTLSLFDHPGRLDTALQGQDLVYVGGGSTLNLLTLWRLHGLDRLLAEASRNGTILAGISAGMNCWFEASSTDSFGELAPLHDGLGWLPGGACPHYLGEPGRRDLLHQWVASGDMPDTWAADDNVAIIWNERAMTDIVTEVPGKYAARVRRVGNGAVETVHTGRYLG